MSSLQAATGIFIFNQTSSHPKSSSKVIEYNSYRKSGAITTFRTPSGKSIRIKMFQPLTVIPYLDPQKTGGIRSSRASYYKQHLAAFKQVYRQYPNAQPYLGKQITRLSVVVEKLSSGHAWFEGGWVDDSRVDVILAERVQKKRALADQRDENTRKVKTRKQMTILEQQLKFEERELKKMNASLADAEDELSSLKHSFKEGGDKLNKDLKSLCEKIK